MPETYSDDYIQDAVGRVLSSGKSPTSGQQGEKNAPLLPEIISCGHPVLRAKATPFSGQIDQGQLLELIDLMRLTMLDAPGVGLAAPQLGIPLQLAVLEDQYPVTAELAALRERHPLEFFAMLNPEYTPEGTALASHFEGCLSMPGWQAVVDRPAAVALKYDDVTGVSLQRRFSGWQARIVAHETDHLLGTIYIDKAHTRSLCSSKDYANFWANTAMPYVAASLGFTAGDKDPQLHPNR